MGPKINADVVQASRVVVEAVQLAGEEDAGSFLGGVLDGLASLVKHDAAGVYLMNRTGRRFKHTMMRGCDLPPDLDAALEGDGIVGEALGSGKPVAVTTATSGEAAVGRPCAKSRLVVPIVGNGSKVLGALDVWSDDVDGYDGDAAALIGVYSQAVAVAIEGSRLVAEVVDRRRLDSDLALARQVMEELLPHATPSIPGFDIAGAHETSLAVGGDYYEFISMVDDRWVIVVADVVGKGIAAALLVSALRASIASLVEHELAVRAVMRRANRFLHESIDEGRYVTLFYGVIDPSRRRMLYVNAGHVPPLLRRASGEIELLEEGGVPLGMFEAPRYVEGHIALREGDILALYTDGIVETEAPGEDFYGVERLEEKVATQSASSAAEICSGIMRDVRHHGGHLRADDRTLVVMKAVPLDPDESVTRLF